MKPLVLKLRSGNAHGTDARPAGGPSGDSLGRGMDIALTLLVFLGLGALIDRWLGIFPVFTILLVVIASLGTFVRLKYTYDATMERLEAERREAMEARSPITERAA
ncbi:MAG TPA: AtpZ/AtpI family protein [Ilumatobacter sp.]|nr:AtpZ/AtpI family protein [Ilumatobacter sp.]